VVAGQLPRTENNTLLHLFSASAGQLDYGAGHYQKRSADTSTLIDQLFAHYSQEGLIVGYTMTDFRRWYAKEHLKDLSPEERLEGMSLEERLKGLSPEEIRRYLEQLEQGGAAQGKAKPGRRKRTS
jgi:hypothetical protein